MFKNLDIKLSIYQNHNDPDFIGPSLTRMDKHLKPQIAVVFLNQAS